MKRILLLLTLAVATNAQAQFRLPNLDINKMVDTVRNVGKAVKEIEEPEEIAIGRDVASRLLGAAPLVADPGLQRYVNRSQCRAARSSSPAGCSSACAARPSSPACSATRSCTS
jgi:predicted Zn-dependent protease